MLARANWLELHPHVGARVRHPSLEEVRDLFHVREILEREATRLAATRATPADIEILKEIVARGWRAVEEADSDHIAALNFEFHRTIGSIAGNARLLAMLGDIEKQVRWHFTAVAVPRRTDSWYEHEAIIDAIEQGDAEKAGELICEHNRHTLTAYIDALLAGRA